MLTATHPQHQRAKRVFLFPGTWVVTLRLFKRLGLTIPTIPLLVVSVVSRG